MMTVILLHRFAGLCKAGSLTRGRLEMPVAQASAASFEQDHFLAVLRDVTEIFTGLGVVNHCPARHFHNLVLTVLSETAVAEPLPP